MNSFETNGATSQQASTSSLANSIFDTNMPCAQFVNSNEDECNFTRSAAVMIFNGKIFDAIECLKRASDVASSDKSNGSDERDSTSLRVIALALSAYLTSANLSEKSALLWNETCSNLKPKLRDPYIKAIFTFLSISQIDDHSYGEIIVSCFCYE